ncbi:MAG: S8 family serine peptidase, partial [Candidatus Eisenbacteria bacterium]|nr:S8 family serine peptidase [Candidatus Eisenbacteria bacterium]
GAVARRDTPDFSPMQGYLYDSPLGLFADSAWTFPGGKGQGVRVLGLEFGWQWTHEDLKDPFYLTHDQGPSDHGTATIGEIMGQHNGYGVNGVAPDVQIGGIWVEDLASAILEAISVLSPGDVYNMSLQTDGNLPVELWPDWFAAIQTGSALGVNCLEAAGNGGANLDDPGLGGKFDRHVRDSGAVMCGAGRPTNLGAESFSNYGERVSLQAWGSSVVTTGYGDLQGGDPDVRYTANFGGTSSATPMVAGVVASLEGQSLALFGVPLTPWLVEEILSMTGTPYAGDRKIGERPNLAAARGRLLQGFGDVLVTVRDGDSHEPVPDMAIEIEETGRSQLTGPEGQVRMQLTTGALTFHVLGNYFFDEASYPFVVEQGGDQEVTLDLFRRPHGSLAGIVRDERGAGIPGVAVVVAGTPLDTVRTAEDGSYSIPQIPANGGYTALATHVSGKGSDATTFDVAGGEVTVWNPVLVDAETFEDGPAGFAGVGGFELGTPTFPANPHPDPYSGLNCWSTSLHAPYPNNATMTLTSPVYDLSGATELTLSFFHWFWIAGEDGGALQVWDAPHHGWVTVPPLGGYPDTNIPVLNGPGFNGRQTFWNPAIFPLDEWTGGSFQFRLLFRSDATGQLVGWNIDDIAIDTGQGESASIDPAEFSVEITNDLVVEPNPAVRESRIRFALAASSDVKLELYDARGALLRVLEPGTLPAGEHAIRWDGLDRAGRPAPPGLYFY